jgi:hypothetical protein
MDVNMKTLITLLVLIAMVGLVMWQYKADYRALETRQQHVPDPSVAKDQEIQHDCADKAAARVKQLGLQYSKTTKYSAHFNATLNQCYALIENTDKSLDIVWNHITLYDADGKVFAAYAWHSQPGQSAADIPPFTCEVTLPTGEHRDCNSEGDFRSLVAAYMK